MMMRRMIGLAGILPLMVALAMALPGCGGGATETNPDGTVKLAPGTVELDKEYEQTGQTNKAK